MRCTFTCIFQNREKHSFARDDTFLKLVVHNVSHAIEDFDLRSESRLKSTPANDGPAKLHIHQASQRSCR